MTTATITKNEAESLIDACPGAELVRKVDLWRGTDFDHYVLMDSALYVDGWFTDAYDAFADEAGGRLSCDVIYVGEVGTPDRRPLVRTYERNAEAIQWILAKAEALANA